MYFSTIIVATLLASNGTGATLVRFQPGTTVRGPGYVRLVDDFSADTSVLYTGTGTWAISTGRLRNTTATDAQAWLRSSLVAMDMRVSAVVRAAAINLRYPCLALRAVDASNMTFVLVSNGAIRVYDRVSGVNTQAGADIVVSLSNDTDYSIEAKIEGATVSIVFGGTTYTRTSTRTGTGMGGVVVGSFSGSTEVQFDDLAITKIR